MDYMQTRNFAYFAISLILLTTLFINLTNASYIPKTYYMYYPFNVSHLSTAVLMYNSNSNSVLEVMNDTEFNLFKNVYNSTYKTIFNTTVSGANIILLNVSPGSYHLVLDAKYSNIFGNISVLTAPPGKGRLLYLKNNYTLKIPLTNFSDINISWLGTFPSTLYLSGKKFPIKYTNNFTDNYYNIRYIRNKGNYTLNINASKPEVLFLYLNITPTLIYPTSLYLTNISSPKPIGVASYGLYAVNGRFIPYVIKTDELEGKANITRITAYSSSQFANGARAVASLQLNGVLNIVSNSGKNYTYWLQDDLQIDTSNMSYNYLDNIWNYTLSGWPNLSNGTVMGKGNVSSYQNATKKTITFYAYRPNTITPYLYSFQFEPIMRINYSNGYPVINFGYSNSLGTYYYDNVTIAIPSSNATFLITPYEMAPEEGQFYDAELVFGGGFNGTPIYFSQINAALWIYYNLDGSIVPFPSAYTFGLDTAETVSGVAVTASESKIAQVSVGFDNLSDVIDHSAPPSASTISSTSITSTSVSSTTVAGTTLQPNVISTSTIPPTSTIELKNQQNQSKTNSNTYLILESVAVLAIIIIIVYIAVTKSKNKNR